LSGSQDLGQLGEDAAGELIFHEFNEVQTLVFGVHRAAPPFPNKVL
jgi:hypothetical protein